MNIQFDKQIHHVKICTKENVKTILNPVAIVILPCWHLATKYILGFLDGRFMSSIHQVLGHGQSGQISSNNGHGLFFQWRQH